MKMSKPILKAINIKVIEVKNEVHQCSACGKQIKNGDSYYLQSGVRGFFQCRTCFNITTALCMKMLGIVEKQIPYPCNKCSLGYDFENCDYYINNNQSVCITNYSRLSGEST